MLFTAFLLNGIALSAQEAPLHPIDIDNNSEKEEESWSPLAIRLILGTLCLEFCFITADEESQQKIKQQLTPKNLLPHIAKQYITYFIVNTAHEFGHAYIAHRLNNDPFNIHLGGNSNNRSAPLIKGTHLTLHGLDPLAGHTFFTKPITRNRTLDKKRYQAILAAGPLSGIAANYILQAALNLTNKSEQVPFITNPLTVHQLCNLFLPLISSSASSDAAKIYRETLNIPEKYIKMASQLAMPVELFAQYYFILKKSKRGMKIPPHTITLAVLSNWLLRGFIRLEL